MRDDISRDPFRLSFYNRAHQYAYGGLRWARQTKRDLAAAANGPSPVSALIEQGSGYMDQRVIGSAPPLAAGNRPLPDALEALWEAAGAANQFNRNTVVEAMAAVPENVQTLVSRVIMGQVAVINARAEVLTDADLDDDLAEALFDIMPSTMMLRADFSRINMAHEQIRSLLEGGFVLEPLFRAGRDLTRIIEGHSWASVTGLEGFAVELDTPMGRIIINDATEQTVGGDEAPLLVLDLGGNDHYTTPVAATNRWDRPVSVLIELGGNDRYGFVGDDGEPEIEGLAPADAAGRYAGDHPQAGDRFGPFSLSQTYRQGAGVMGVGLSFDFDGDDIYLSHKISQGAGVLGLGVLFDGGGNDIYRSEQGSQGAGTYGMGLLIDRVGDDRYIAVQSVQGYAYVRGFAYLHDEAGNDHYTAMQGDPALGGAFFFPNAQNATSNTSLAQGAGFGRRGDAHGDNIFASGGLGVFRDGGGSDRYLVDVFGQGSGFWYGTGLFSDGGDGDDVYEGRWYVQGSGAHFAMSFFFEEGGNDRYNRTESIIATATGQGHDLSLGWLVDEGGDDEWIAPGLGLGAGNDNGIGFFLDLGGDDSYDVPDSSTYGGANIGDRGPIFDESLCLGIFLDADGTDEYLRFEEDALIGNDRTWSWAERRENAKPGAHGAGLDLVGGQLDLP
jgi:hypothetical protein